MSPLEKFPLKQLFFRDAFQPPGEAVFTAGHHRQSSDRGRCQSLQVAGGFGGGCGLWWRVKWNFGLRVGNFCWAEDLIKGWVNGWMEHCVEAWVEGWVDAWVKGWMEAWR